MASIAERLQIALDQKSTHVSVWRADEGGRTSLLTQSVKGIVMQICYLEQCEKAGYNVTFHKKSQRVSMDTGGLEGGV
jgi:hypothetical protein